MRRLRGFERVTLQPGQSRTVSFTLDKSDFGFYDNAGEFVVEPGRDRPLRRRLLDGDADEVLHREGVTSQPPESPRMMAITV